MARVAPAAAQQALPLDWSAAGSNDPPLLVGACNAEALRFLAHPALWPVRCAVLVGPPKSGRSLIGRVFARTSGGDVVDGPSSVSEEALFHSWNAAQANGRPLLIIADAPPAEWPVALPDLRSRLAAVPVVRIGELDDAHARELFEAQFAQRGIAIAPDVAAFVVQRMHRSHATLARIVAALDGASLAQGRRIGKRLASEILRDQGLIVDDLVDQAGAAQ
jgi:Bacterial dnaA  protein